MHSITVGKWNKKEKEKDKQAKFWKFQKASPPPSPSKATYPSKDIHG